MRKVIAKSARNAIVVMDKSMRDFVNKLLGHNSKQLVKIGVGHIPAEAWTSDVLNTLANTKLRGGMNREFQIGRIYGLQFLNGIEVPRNILSGRSQPAKISFAFIALSDILLYILLCLPFSVR